MCENKAVLYGKMAKVMGTLGRIKETGKHQQGWKYATSEDVKDAVRVAMSEVGLALLVSLEDHEVISLDKGVIVRGKMAFTLCCSETGATETRHLVGEAADQAKVSDKAFYKLYTTLEKYYLKTTFLISSGEELDSDSDVPDARRNKTSNGGMSLGKLLALLRKVEVSGMATFYESPEAIMACRAKGSPLPAADDTQGWRNLFEDARDYAIDRINEAIERGDQAPDPMPEAEAVQSAMDEIEAVDIPWQQKNPSMDDFLAIASEEFGIERQGVLDELKAAGFSGYKSSAATKMWEALEAARAKALEEIEGETDGIESEYPEIFNGADEVNQTDQTPF